MFPLWLVRLIQNMHASLMHRQSNRHHGDCSVNQWSHGDDFFRLFVSALPPPNKTYIQIHIIRIPKKHGKCGSTETSHWASKLQWLTLSSPIFPSEMGLARLSRLSRVLQILRLFGAWHGMDVGYLTRYTLKSPAKTGVLWIWYDLISIWFHQNGQESTHDNPIFYGTLNFSLSNLEFIHISIHLVVFFRYSIKISRSQDPLSSDCLVLSDLESNPPKRNINQQAFEDHCPTRNYR